MLSLLRWYDAINRHGINSSAKMDAVEKTGRKRAMHLFSSFIQGRRRRKFSSDCSLKFSINRAGEAKLFPRPDIWERITYAGKFKFPPSCCSDLFTMYASSMHFQELCFMLNERENNQRAWSCFSSSLLYADKISFHITRRPCSLSLSLCDLCISSLLAS